MNKYFFIFSGVLILTSKSHAMDSGKGPDYFYAVAQEEFKNLVHAHNTPALVKFFKFGPVAHLRLPDFLLLETTLQRSSEWLGQWKEREALITMLVNRIQLEKIILATVYN